MPLTVNDYRTLVRQQLDVDATDLPNTLIDTYLRMTHHNVVRGDVRWPFFEETYTFTVTGGQATYPFTAIAADVEEIAKLRSPNTELRHIGVEDAEAAWPRNVSTSGDPAFYSTWRDGMVPQFTLYPTPGSTATYVARVYKAPLDFVSAGDLGSPTDLPEEFHYLILLGVMEQAYRQQDIPELSRAYKQQYDEQYLVLKQRYRRGSVEQPLVVGEVSTPFGVPPRLRYPFE